MVFAKTANHVVSTIPTHAGTWLKLGNAAEAPIVRANTSTYTRQPPTPRRLRDNAATLHRERPRAKVEAEAEAAKTNNPRAHGEVTSPSRHGATDHAAESVQNLHGPLDKGGVLSGPASAQRTPC